MKQEELKKILKLHLKWLNREKGGVCADLTFADLYGANFTGANLSGAKLTNAFLSEAILMECEGLDYSSCTFAGHGEYGRQLSLVKINDELVFFCGCFKGSPKELKKYIENGEEKYKKSRTLAMEFCLSAIEMN
jgi:hypothetical protein